MPTKTKKRASTEKPKARGEARRQDTAVDVTYANPYINLPTKRFETKVEFGNDIVVVHKGVVYHVKHDADTETVVLASNHRWRPGFLMVIISPRDISAEEAHKLINDYANRFIWCHKCLREGVGHTSFRMDIDLKSGKFKRVVCAYCDPTADFIAGFFDGVERSQASNNVGRQEREVW
jgi:hypothetical protein